MIYEPGRLTMNTKIYKYCRISTKDQNEQLQIDAINKEFPEYGALEFFTDKQTGRNTDRPKLNKIMEQCRKGDTLICYDISRLARNVKQLLILIDTLEAEGVNIVILNEDYKTGSATSRMMLTLMGAIAEMESANISRKVKAGVESAKAQGKHCGRPAITYPKGFGKYYNQVQAKQITATMAMAQLKLKKTSYYKLVKAHEAK